MSMPKGWEEVRLGDICDIYDGTHQTPKYVENGIPFLSVENITNNNFDNTKFISEEEHKQLTKKVKIQKNDILMTRIGTLGVCKLVDWDFEASYYVSLALLRVKQGVLPLFLAQYADSSYFLNEVKKRSLLLATPPKINLGDISGIKIKLPPLKEQEKIAEILSSCDEHIKNLKNLKSELEKEKLHLMNELLSGKTRFANFTTPWQEATLNDLGTTYNGLSGKKAKDFEDGNSNYITYKNIFDNRVVKTSIFEKVKINDDEKQNLVKKGDVFFTTSSETPHEVGTSSVILEEYENLYLNSFCFGFRPNESINSEYASFYFRSSIFREKLTKLAQGSTRYNLSKTEFLKIKIKLPSLEEQKKIGEVLSACDERLECLNELITAETTLKSHLLTELLSGNIRVKDFQ